MNISKRAYSEVYSIIMSMSESDQKRIPQDIIDNICSNIDKNYSPEFDINVPIKDLDICEEAKGILAYLYAQYFTNSEDEKLDFVNILKGNEFKGNK